MRELYNNVLTVELSTDRPKDNVMRELSELALSFGYKIVDTDMSKPWGGFIRFDTSDAGSFVENFFPGKEISWTVRWILKPIDKSANQSLLKSTVKKYLK